MTDLRIDRFNNAEQVIGHNTGSNPERDSDLSV